MAGKLKVSEIAAKTGLSVSTVSRVLAGKANTSPRAKQLVLQCAREQGILENLSFGRLLFNHLLVFAPARAFDVRTDVFYYRMIQGIRKAVEPYDIHVTYCAIEEEGSDVQLFLKRLSDPAVEAALIIGIDDHVVHELAADVGKPCVLVNCRDKRMRLDAVLPDHHQIAAYSAEYLFQQGHRDILTLMCLRRFTLEWRLNGIRDAYAAHNMPFEEERHLIATSGFSAEEAEQALTTYLDAFPAAQYPTAILTGGDYLAEGVIKALQKRGYAVPGDFSVMSIDGLNLSLVRDITLTAAHVPREELVLEAIGLLQRRITRPGSPACNMLVSGELISGDSVKRAGNRKLKAAVATRDHGLYQGRT